MAVDNTAQRYKLRASTPEEGFDCWWVDGQDGFEVGAIYGSQGDPARQTIAHMIAAAPDLYAAVLSAIAWFDQAEYITPAECGVCGSFAPRDETSLLGPVRHAPDCPLGSLIAARDLARGDGA